MKKQILSLMLSTAIFTTNPLFAMEKDPEIQESRVIPHSCPTCTQTVEYQLNDIQETEGKGNFRALTNDSIIYTISLLDLKDVHTVSSTSKVMYNLCQNPFIWNSLSDKDKGNFIFSPLLKCPKIIFKTAYLEYPNLFKEETPEVKVPISWLLSRKDVGLARAASFSAYNLNYLSCFEIGKNSLVLYSAREKDLSILKNMDGKDYITFSWFSEGQCPWEKTHFRSKGFVPNNDNIEISIETNEIDIENCFCIQNAKHFFK